MNTYIKKTHIAEHEFSEIDFDLYDEFGFESGDDDEFIVIKKGHGAADGYPIKIDRMIEALTTLKNSGATHVELDYHVDHIGYEISGYEIRKATPEETEAYEINRRHDREILAKREDLLRQLRGLDREAHDKKEDEKYPF